MSRTAEYNAWLHIKQRCYNPKARMFYRYGARGIVVCDRWKISFENFLADMGPRPSPHHSIDRIDNDGNYEPKNCRWATRHQQMANTSRNVNISIGGETFCASEWERRTGISHGTILSRIENGWPEEMLLVTKRHVKVMPGSFTMLTHDGYTLPLRDMAIKHGLTPKALSTRLSRGSTLEQALSQPLQKRRVAEIKPQL